MKNLSSIGFLQKTISTVLFIVILLFNIAHIYGQDAREATPNVIIIITDDQGFGDLGYQGNPHVKTPEIDKFASQSIRFNNFYVSPVCAPTRSSLMTGRYSLRTGVRDTYNGGAIMAPDEITIAEILKMADYKTGIFGKWHLGDNYPSRPSDQGFDESLIHLAGGMGQVGDVTNYFKGDTSYFDPVLWRNDQKEQFNGYCSDIFTDNAIDFIEKNREAPFFCYLSFNAPHTPLQVPSKYYEMYKDIDPSTGFENDDRPFVAMSEEDKEDARKVYGMVTNIDDNVGRLLRKLDELDIADDTLVIFMTDNGPEQNRYIAGMRGLKSSVFQGGVRVPFLLRYPKRFKGSRDVDDPVAHIDILPTLCDLSNLQLPSDRLIDGKSLVPLLKGDQIDWENRPLFFYWSRRYPELYHNIALQRGRYKLVGRTDFNAQILDFELFDILNDPYEKNNIVFENKGKAIELKGDLDSIYGQLIKSPHLLDPPRIVVGSPKENPVILNRNDADGERGVWNQEEIFGKWNVSVEAGLYNFRFKFMVPLKSGGRMYLETKGGINQKVHTAPNTDIIEMNGITLNKMESNLIPFYSIDGRRILPFWIEIEKIAN
ncbi:MAG: arylsulfatase [Flagellimonas sp.]